MEMRIESGLPEELEALCQRVIGAAIEVHRHLGPGFAEKTYQRAMEIELSQVGIDHQAEAPVNLEYKGADANPRKYTRQVTAYLKAAKLQLGLIINFENELLKQGIARIVHDPHST